MRCQGLRVPGCALGSAAAARPVRPRPSRVTCAAGPDGGLPGSGPGGGKPKPSSSRRSASRGLGEQGRLDSPMLQPAFSTEAEEEQGGRGGAGGSTQHSALAAPGQDGSQEAKDSSWESWQKYFWEMDDLVQEMESVHTDMEEAVKQEDYSAAAALKAQLSKLEAADCVGEALSQLDAAVAEERFQDAARLRDESGVGLQGWWVGHGEGDVSGHLLRVTSDFARYVGHAYTPRDLIDLMELDGSSSSRATRDPQFAAAAAALLQSSGGGLIEEAGPLLPEDVGLPVFELFLRRAAEGSGAQYEQQAAALYAPEDALAEAAGEVEQEAVASSLAEFIATETTGGDVVSIERGQLEDGTAYMQIGIGSIQPGDEDGEGQDGAEVNDEDIRTIDDLAASVGMGGMQQGGADAASQAAGSSSSGRGEVDEEEEQQLQRWREAASAAAAGSSSRGGDEEAGGASGRGIQEDVDALTEALLAAGSQLQQEQEQQWEEDDGELVGDEEGMGGAPEKASQIGCFLQRAPAEISWESRDRFTISISEPPAIRRQRLQEAAEAAAAAAAQAPPLQRPPVRIIYDGKEQMRPQQPQDGEQQQQQQGAGEASRSATSSNGSSSDASSRSSSSSRRTPDGSLDVEITSEESESEEISVLLSPQQQPDVAQQQREQQRLEQRLEQEAVAEDSAALAEQIEAVKEGLQAGVKPSKEVINEITRRAMGLAIAQGITSANQAGAALAERWASMEGRTSYQRLPQTFVKTDPFDGLYVGSYGQHGPELLRVSRQVEGGKEWAVATKLTGDPNVPAGRVSWKALIGRANRLSADIYPPEMAVMGRFKGMGQVAQAGFTNAKWVEGELLVFGADSPFVQGAQLGFTYDVNATQRYLIVLHRVDLDELFPEDA